MVASPNSIRHYLNFIKQFTVKIIREKRTFKVHIHISQIEYMYNLQKKKNYNV